MALRSDPEPTVRSIPRWIAYPVLLLLPIACIYFGILLGRDEVGSFLMVASHNDTPVENWTLGLIALVISLYVYADWAYKNRTFRCDLFSFLLIAGFVVAMFVFGAWGLLVGMLPCLALYLVAWRRVRQARKPAFQDDVDP